MLDLVVQLCRSRPEGAVSNQSNAVWLMTDVDLKLHIRWNKECLYNASDEVDGGAENTYNT